MRSERWISLLHKKRLRLFRGVFCCLTCLFLCANSVRVEQRFATVYHEHNNQERKIALTFDDGPHPTLTPKILDILKKYNVKATFFVVGENVKNYPDVVERILNEGHELGNHTYTHDTISSTEIEACENAILELTDQKPKIFRPPEGLINKGVKAISADLGYDIILWSIDTRDWDHTPPKTICGMVLNNLKTGSIILMHDYIGHNSPTPTALEYMLPKILEMDYRFVVVSELIGTK